MISSRFLMGVSYFFLFFPVSYVVLSAIFFNIPGGTVVTLLISPSFYLLSAAAICVGYGFKEMKRWVWYLFLVVSAMVIYHNAHLIVRFSESNYKLSLFFLSTLAIAAVVYRVAKEIRVPYFLPRIRWWESDSQIQFSVPVSLRLNDDKKLEGRILDISPRGCFIQLSALPSHEAPVRIAFRAFGQTLGCNGKIVWRTEGAVTHPRGIGVIFDSLDRKKKRQLRIASKRLKKVFELFRRGQLISDQTEFRRILDELQNSKVDKSALIS